MGDGCGEGQRLAASEKSGVGPVVLGGLAAVVLAAAVFAYVSYFQASKPPEPAASAPAVATAPGTAPATDSAPDTASASASGDNAAAAPATPDATDTSAQPEVTAAPPPPAPEPAVPSPILPVFDTVRVEPDGATIIAGRAAPGATVAIMLDGSELTRAEADNSGAFVAILSLPPATSPRGLSLLADPEGTAVASDQTVLVAPFGQTEVATAEPPAGDAAATGAPAPSTPQSAAPAAPAPDMPAADAGSTGPEIASNDASAPEVVASAAEPGAAATTAPASDSSSAPAAPDAGAVVADAGAPTSGTDNTGSSASTGALATGEGEGAAPAPTHAADGAAPAPAANDTQPALPPAPSSAATAQALPPSATVPTPDAATPAAPAADGNAANAPAPAATPPAPPAVAAAPTAPEAPAETDVAAAAAPPVLLLDSSGVSVLQPATSPDAPPDIATEVALDAITYGADGAARLTGRAAPGSFVRVYLDNDLKSTTKAVQTGAWAVTLPDVPAGVYTLRIDQLDAAGKVTSRIETPFRREAPEALAAASQQAANAPDTAGAPAASVTVVQPGNTLWAIARKRYGLGIMYVQVFEANRARIRNPDLIYPGQVFVLPDVEPAAQ